MIIVILYSHSCILLLSGSTRGQCLPAARSRRQAREEASATKGPGCAAKWMWQLGGTTPACRHPRHRQESKAGRRHFASVGDSWLPRPNPWPDLDQKRIEQETWELNGGLILTTPAHDRSLTPSRRCPTWEVLRFCSTPWKGWCSRSCHAAVSGWEAVALLPVPKCGKIWPGSGAQRCTYAPCKSSK